MTDGRQYQAGEKTEDALAAYERIILCGDCPSEVDLDEWLWEEDRIVRRRLTAEPPCTHVRTSAEGTSYCALAEPASAVPHIPEQIRRLPERWSGWAQEKSVDESIVIQNCADDLDHELERAINSAPADANNANVTCECERGPREIVENTDEGGTKWWTLATHCTDCLESASASTDGRE